MNKLTLFAVMMLVIPTAAIGADDPPTQWWADFHKKGANTAEADAFKKGEYAFNAVEALEAQVDYIDETFFDELFEIMDPQDIADYLSYRSAVLSSCACADAAIDAASKFSYTPGVDSQIDGDAAYGKSDWAGAIAGYSTAYSYFDLALQGYDSAYGTLDFDSVWAMQAIMDSYNN